MNDRIIAAVSQLRPGEVLVLSAAWPTEQQVAKLYLDFAAAKLKVKISLDPAAHEIRIVRL